MKDYGKIFDFLIKFIITNFEGNQCALNWFIGG